MGMLKIAVAGALGYVAYKAWQRQDAASDAAVADADDGRPQRASKVTDTTRDIAEPARAGAQTSAGFGNA